MPYPATALHTVTLAFFVAIAAAQIATDTAPTSRPDPDLPKTRERFSQRSNACVACQRAVCHLDENMLPKVFDEMARVERSGKSAQFGQFEGIVESEVSSMCGAQPITMEPGIRKQCSKLLEKHEEQFVKAWYDVAVNEATDTEKNMNYKLCSETVGVAKVCPDDLAELDVPTLVRLETRQRWDNTNRRNEKEMERRKKGDKSEKNKNARGAFDKLSVLDKAPKRMTQRPVPRPPPGSGALEHFVSSDFVKRAIGLGDGNQNSAENTDVVVYFAFPRTNPGIHAGALNTLNTVSRAVAKHTRSKPREGAGRGGKGGKSRGASRPVHTTLFAVVDAERNEIPHPWGAGVESPSFILFPANGKDKPRLMPFRDEGAANEDRPSHAPTPADVLALLQKRGGRHESREVAGVAMVHMEQRVLEGSGRDALEEELDEL